MWNILYGALLLTGAEQPRKDFQDPPGNDGGIRGESYGLQAGMSSPKGFPTYGMRVPQGPHRSVSSSVQWYSNWLYTQTSAVLKWCRERGEGEGKRYEGERFVPAPISVPGWNRSSQSVIELWPHCVGKVFYGFKMVG